MRVRGRSQHRKLNMTRVGVIEGSAEEVVNRKKSGIVGITSRYRYDKDRPGKMGRANVAV